MSKDPSDWTRQFIDLLPEGATIDDTGELRIAGCRASDLAARYGTPLYVVDEGALRARVRRFRTALEQGWPNSMVHFASKAFPSTSAYQLMAEEGVGVDVAGGGELVMALAGGTNPAHIVVHGNAKTDAEITMALDAHVGLIVVDNFDDVEKLERLATSRQDVLVRVIPGIEAPTHEAMATGQHRSKFGLNRADAATAMERIRASRHLRLRGVHVHIGSQISDLAPFREAVEAVASLGTFEIYDVGGGLGARYTFDDVAPEPEDWIAALTQTARRVLPASSRLLIEPGRSMVARSGVTLYRVVSVKRGEPTFVAVDGGMGDNLDVSLYGQRFEAALVDRIREGAPAELVGRHCESGDRLVSNALLGDAVPGDVIVVAATGAYCFTMANNYNGALRPAVVYCGDGESVLRVRRETYDDLTARDVASL